jgi:hypothetical protein
MPCHVELLTMYLVAWMPAINGFVLVALKGLKLIPTWNLFLETNSELLQKGHIHGVPSFAILGILSRVTLLGHFTTCMNVSKCIKHDNMPYSEYMPGGHISIKNTNWSFPFDLSSVTIIDIWPWRAVETYWPWKGRIEHWHVLDLGCHDCCGPRKTVL